MAKATKATIKSFIKKNSGNIYLLGKRYFDGMVDGCVETSERAFSKAEPTDRFPSNTMGVQGAWFVGNSRDYFMPYSDEQFTGYEVYNCCARFILAVPKEVTV